MLLPTPYAPVDRCFDSYVDGTALRLRAVCRARPNALSSRPSHVHMVWLHEEGFGAASRNMCARCSRHSPVIAFLWGEACTSPSTLASCAVRTVRLSGCTVGEWICVLDRSAVPSGKSWVRVAYWCTVQPVGRLCPLTVH